MGLNPLEWLKAAGAIDRLLSLEAKHSALLEAPARDIQDLKDRVTKLEVREQVLIAEAKAAAAAAASAVAAQHVADLARHVGRLDERTRQLRGPLSREPDRG